MKTWRRVLFVLLTAALSGCARIESGGSASPTGSIALDRSVISDAQLAAAGVDANTTLASWPIAAISEAEALQVALKNAQGGAEHGPVITEGRALGREGAGSAFPLRSVWVFVLGPGGSVPVIGPRGGSRAIRFQIIQVNDQTGAFVRDYSESG